MTTSPPIKPVSPAAAWSDSVLSTSVMRPSVMQLTLKDRAALHAAYIPAFKEGGIFSMTSREYGLGDELYVLLTLPEDTQRYAIAGIVAWITPANNTQSGRGQGVGIRFPNDANAASVKRKIEALLGPARVSDRPNQTI
jgi:type IV pilus assembly protein PilZ